MSIRVHFIAADGGQTDIEAKEGESLMQAAVSHNLPGIEADCGGLATCGTCHVYVREPHATQLPPVQEDEHAMLDFTAAPRRANSRLSCQIQVSPALQGLTVDLPDTQH